MPTRITTRRRLGTSRRGAIRSLRSADHHQPDAHRSDRGDFYPRQWRRAGQRFCGHDQLGRCHDLDGHDYPIGQHLFRDRFAYLCGQRHLHDRDLGGGADCTTAAASAAVDAAGESDQQSRSPRFALELSDGSVMVEAGSAVRARNKLTPDATGSYVNGTWSTSGGLHALSTQGCYESCSPMAA